jgi:hypothetical protein
MNTSSLYNSRYGRRSRGLSGGVLVAILVVLFILVCMGISYGVAHASAKTQVFTVTRLSDQYNYHNQKHQYMIFGKNEQGRSVTFKSTDSLWFMKFNSSDVWGQLEDGHKYSCLTTGFRIALRSSYPNVIHCEEVH